MSTTSDVHASLGVTEQQENCAAEDVYLRKQIRTAIANGGAMMIQIASKMAL